MKKIIALVVVALGFSFSAVAQQKKAVAPAGGVHASHTAPAGDADFKKDANKDLAALDKIVTLNDADKKSILGLLTYKYREFKVVGESKERRNVLAQTVEAKLRATLTAEQMAKLEASPAVFKQVTH